MCIFASWLWLANFGKVYDRAEDGTPIRFIGLTLDINERKETQIALAELNKNLESRVEEEVQRRELQESIVSRFQRSQAAYGNEQSQV